jgi:PPOX class probable F420-dependent enzyme
VFEELTDDAIALLESDAVATVTTISPDGSPYMFAAWVGLENGEIVIGTLTDQRKLRNVRRDPRIALIVQSELIDEWGLREYLLIEGTARVTEGGGAALLQRLAYTYLGQGVRFPTMTDPPAGYVTRIRIERVKGVGSWLRSG